MSVFRIEWKPSAANNLKVLPKKEQRRIAKKVDSLAIDPTPTDVKKLSVVENMYRVRTGDYRILYDVRKKILVILELRIGHPKNVYR